MRCLERNKTPIKYALYLGKVDVVDSSGNKTGEKTLSYGDAVSMKACVSEGGQAQVEQFGTDLQYDRVLVMETCPFDENAILWIDDLTGEHDYVVSKIAKSLNSVLVAVRRVNG